MGPISSSSEKISLITKPCDRNGWEWLGQETKGSKDGKGKDSYWKDEKARFEHVPQPRFDLIHFCLRQGKKDGWKGKSKDSGNGRDSGKVGDA